MQRKPARYGIIRRFSRDREGSTAIEFAMIAGPFFLLVLATLEIALIFFAGSIIENAVVETARDIRTGRLQTSGGTEETFRAAVCERVSVIADCGRLAIDVRTFEDFSSTDFSSPLDGDGEIDENGFTFAPGGAGDIVVVRAFYPWQIITPSLGLGLANMSGNRRMIASATAFRNEPFQE